MSARAALAIARREFMDRWLLIPVTLVAGFGPNLLAALGRRQIPPLPRPEEPLAVVISGVAATVFAMAVAVLLGTSVGGRDLVERRLGFYFARPVGWRSVLLGQALAIASLLALSTLVGLLPLATTLLQVEGHRAAAFAVLRHAAGEPLQFLLRGPAVTVAVLSLLTALSAGLFGIAFRVRSRWLVLDLAGLLALVGFGLHVAARLEAESAFPRFTPEFLGVVCGSATLAFVAGLGSALAHGRGDAIRAHRGFSAAAWPLLALFAMLGLWRLEAALRGDPAAPSIRSIASPDGRWQWKVSEKEPWLWGRTAFLVRTDGSVAVRIGSDWLTTAVFSSDSRRVAWTNHSLQGDASRVVAMSLGDVAPTTQLTFPGSHRSFGAVLAFSPAGDRLAHVDGDRVRLHRWDGSGVEERLLPLPATRVEHLRFSSEDRLCLRADHGRGARVRDYQVSLAPGGGVEPGECAPE
ncbi:MAG: hypothetical protein KJ067_22930 [Vicinamibacteria bacterium]|nr:hypothetical protein [Vicinamibacteria bacterium]